MLTKWSQMCSIFSGFCVTLRTYKMCAPAHVQTPVFKEARFLNLHFML